MDPEPRGEEVEDERGARPRAGLQPRIQFSCRVVPVTSAVYFKIFLWFHFFFFLVFFIILF